MSSVEDNVFAPPRVDEVPATAEGGSEDLASPGLRLLARIGDNILWWGAFALPFVFLAFTKPGAEPSDSLVGFAATLALMVSVTQWILVSRRGQSMGKIAIGIRIERPDGEAVGFLRGVVLRDWPVLFLDFLVAIPCMGLWGMASLVDALFIFEPTRRTVHDRIADTRVVNTVAGRGAGVGQRTMGLWIMVVGASLTLLLSTVWFISLIWVALGILYVPSMILAGTEVFLAVRGLWTGRFPRWAVWLPIAGAISALFTFNILGFALEVVAFAMLVTSVPAEPDPD